MESSPQKIAANQANGARSKGPKSPEGKAVARRNSLKHGFTGEGVVLPEEDLEILEARFQGFRAELRPIGELGDYHVRRAAFLSIRIERFAQHETAFLSTKMRNARENFDEERQARADQLFDLLMDNPSYAIRRLCRMPEGVDRLLGALRDFREHVSQENSRVWNADLLAHLESLFGRGADDIPVSRMRVLAYYAFARPQTSKPGESSQIPEASHAELARTEMLDLIDQEIARLQKVNDGLDREAIEANREDSVGCVLVSTDREMLLAKRYEAAAVREFERTLKTLDRMAKESDGIAATPSAVEDNEVLGSFCPDEGPIPLHRSPPPPVEPPQPTSDLETGVKAEGTTAGKSLGDQNRS